MDGMNKRMLTTKDCFPTNSNSNSNKQVLFHYHKVFIKKKIFGVKISVHLEITLTKILSSCTI